MLLLFVERKYVHAINGLEGSHIVASVFRDDTLLGLRVHRWCNSMLNKIVYKAFRALALETLSNALPCLLNNNTNYTN